MKVSSEGSGERSSRLKEFLASPRRAVWAVAWPSMAGLLLHTLYGVVDTAFVGLLGTSALAAITFVGPLFFIMIALSSGLGTGVTALVAQAVGRKDTDTADRAASCGISLGLASGLLFLVLGLLFGKDLLTLMGATGQGADMGWDYFLYINLGAPLFFVSTFLRSVLVGEGNTKTPTVVMTVATLVNVTLDPILMFVLHLGIAGAALATVASQTVALSIYLYVFVVRRKGYARVHLHQLWPRATIVRAISRIGLPTALGQLIMAMGIALNNRLLAHFTEKAVAGWGVGTRVDMIVTMPIFAIAMASVSVIGIFAGAGRTDLVRSTALYAFRINITLALTLGVLAYGLADPIMSLFTQDAEAMAIGRMYLGFMLFTYPMMAFGLTGGRILQGLGLGMPSMIITFVRILGVGVPLAYIAVYVLDTPVWGIWAGTMVGAVCSVVLSFFWVRKHVWRNDPTRYVNESVVEPG